MMVVKISAELICQYLTTGAKIGNDLEVESGIMEESKLFDVFADRDANGNVSEVNLVFSNEMSDPISMDIVGVTIKRKAENDTTEGEGSQPSDRSANPSDQ